MESKYDNLYIGIRALHKELLKPHAERDIKSCYNACCMADDYEIRKALMFFVGIEQYVNYLFWSKDTEILDYAGNPYELRVIERDFCDPDDMDKIVELAFELFLQDKGVLI